MDSYRTISWLASYPKSGNTWTRLLLANFIRDEDEPVDINHIGLEGSISSNRPQFDDTIGLPSSDLTPDEVDMLRPRVYEAAAREAADEGNRLYVKVHDAYYETKSGEPLFPPNVSHGAIYLLRNPLDVAVSYAFHSGHVAFEKTVKRMGRPMATMAGRGSNQLRQLTFDWSGHVRSWTEECPFPVHVVRYEDLLHDTETTFSRMLEFLQLEGAQDRQRVKKAVRFSSMKTLQENEEREGFGEKHPGTHRFFRKGAEGDWQNHLSHDQIEKILDDHRDVMRKYGYSTEPAKALKNV